MLKKILVGVVLICNAGCIGFNQNLAGTIKGPFGEYFDHREVFIEGQNLIVALDPARYPGKTGQTYSIYVVNHKPDTQWMADSSLLDVTGAVEIRTLSAGDTSSNSVFVWGNMSLPPGFLQSDYDIVFDFGNDGRYDSGIDLIDRFGVLDRSDAKKTGGFTLIKDPAARGNYHVATYEYDEGDFTVNVPPEYYEAGRPVVARLTGKLYYPENNLLNLPGRGPYQSATTPLTDGNQVVVNPSGGNSVDAGSDLRRFPLIIIAHGNSGVANSYQGYDYLGRHLASRGFICASINLYELGGTDENRWLVHHRGVTILKHIDLLLSDPTSDPVINALRSMIDSNKIGLLGHSRGGEGVMAAEEIYMGLSPGPGYTIRAAGTFSPTDGKFNGVNYDQYGAYRSGPYDPQLPFLLLYGSRDGDMSGETPTIGYRLLDRAKRPRQMVTLYGGNHNFFNSTWPSDGNPVILRSQQETFAKTFVTSFFSNYLNGQQAYSELFSGLVVPPSVKDIGTTVLYSDQPQKIIRLVVDDSQDLPAGEWTNSLGQPNSSSNVIEFREESLRYLKDPDSFWGTENFYYHDTDGLRVSWDRSSSHDGRPSITFGLGNRNLWFYEFLNFRVGNRYRLSGDSFNTGSHLMEVFISDIHGNRSYPVNTGYYLPVYFTDDGANYPKSIMQTVRIPLQAFISGDSPLDPGHASQLTISFRDATGELIFDDIEFLGLSRSEPDRVVNTASSPSPPSSLPVPLLPVKMPKRTVSPVTHNAPISQARLPFSVYSWHKVTKKDGSEEIIVLGKNLYEAVSLAIGNITVKLTPQNNGSLVSGDYPIDAIENTRIKMVVGKYEVELPGRFSTSKLNDLPQISNCNYSWEIAEVPVRSISSVFKTVRQIRFDCVIKGMKSHNAPITAFIGPVVIPNTQISGGYGNLTGRIYPVDKLEEGAPLTIDFGDGLRVLSPSPFSLPPTYK